MSLRAFEDVTVGEELPELRRVVLREDVKAYADAGRDQNPLHQYDDFARSVGFDGIIAHGMFTMGHMAACVVAWAGDPDAVVKLSAQFRAPVFMSEEIVAGGRVRTLDPRTRTAAVATWVTLERHRVRQVPLKRGNVIVRLA